MNNLLCRRVCCCCYSERKNGNAVTLTRAETITVQPTTSAAMEMSQLSNEESRNPKTKKPRNSSGASELDEIDLNERLPTDEDLQPASTAADRSFAVAVTDMMLDEIHDEPFEQQEKITEEDTSKIDPDAVIEATEEEVRNTLTKPLKKGTKDEATVQKDEKEIEAKSLSEEENSPSKPLRTNTSTDEIVEESALSKTDDGLAPLEPSEGADDSVESPKVCDIEEENTEERKILRNIESVPNPEEDIIAVKPATVHEAEVESMIDYGENKEDEVEVEQAHSVEEVLPSEHNVPEDAVDDETTASTDLEMKESHSAQPPESPEPPPLPKDPPPASPVVSTNKPSMYGNLSESDSSETESESLSVPRKKPNRVSVKQTNVVITKVTAIDAPNVEEVSDFESIATNGTNNERPRGYIVLTDEEFSEKVI